MCCCPSIPPGVLLPTTDNGPGEDNDNDVPGVFGEEHRSFQHFLAPQSPYPQRPAAAGPPRAGPFVAVGMNVQLPLRPLPADQVYIYAHALFPAASRHPFYRGGFLDGGSGYAVGPIHSQPPGTGFGLVPLPAYQLTHHVYRTMPARENHGLQIPFILHPYAPTHMRRARQPRQHPFMRPRAAPRTRG
ncbi:hypothetical protein DL764_011007 [Monosporascus ibericus]|uniref:Uncharacterized protein n=1 Tax=Monosporascus ibericus TaxID=155417 RepID=A0A4Q4STX7_9PEZI|nr:hypothetical protein DL764_011007 [Monosporascus ibericus]